MNDQSTDEVTVTIAETVSDTLETPIDELPPLSQSVNLDGLHAIVTDDRSQDVTITFSYAGLSVLVHSAGIVYARPRHTGRPQIVHTSDFNGDEHTGAL